MNTASSTSPPLTLGASAIEYQEKGRKMKGRNLSGIGLMVSIAGMLVILTDGATPWKVLTAWGLWLVGTGVAIYNARLRKDA